MSKKGSFGRFVGRTHTTTDVIVEDSGEVSYRYRSVAAVTPLRNVEGLNSKVNADEYARIQALAERVRNK